MTDLDTLRPEVQRADSFLDSMACTADEEAAVKTIRAELLRLAKIEKDYGFAIDCERRRAESAEAELAALKARIAGSHEVTVCRHPAGAVTMFVPEGMNGKRVRLLVDEPPAEQGEE